ncbi:MAG: hypothetical protein ACYTBS_13185 [Planctomycetota bacterium]|jgi:hypothetical protein
MIRAGRLKCAFAILVVLTVVSCDAQQLWELANANKEVLRISTLFTAQNVRDHLSDESGMSDAIDWCKETGVTGVFIETFRSNYRADRQTLQRAKSRFEAEGFDVSGCVTTTIVGKVSTGWNLISCYTSLRTQQHLKEIFEYTASIFDEIMIDDFLFTDCQCNECQEARGQNSWADYRCELMVTVGRDRILAPARAVNPNVKLIIKYPQWYDNFHNRGYEVISQTADYDRIWVGTETRDFDNERWGGKVQYEAYYIMRWLGEIGGAKTGGGWFDPYGTTEDTYVEQARQTVLADAKEMLLFCYGSLQKDTGPANVRKLRAEIPGLFELAKLVRAKPIRGIAAPKPSNSDAHNEQYVFDFVGMLGLPLVPTAKIEADDAEAAFFSVHALKDPRFGEKLNRMLDAGKPVLITDGLATELKSVDLTGGNAVILKMGSRPRDLLKLSRAELNPIRKKLLAPFGLTFDAPNKVALYLVGENCFIVENFNDEPADVSLRFRRQVEARQVLVLPGAGSVDLACGGEIVNLTSITSRTLVAVEY